MNRLKRTFEIALWNSRLVVICAVISSVVTGVILFVIFTVESFLVLVGLFGYLSANVAADQRDTLLKQTVVRMISTIDGYLLGAFMLIFGFGLYELFLADLQEARSSRTSGRILRVTSLDDLKTRLAKLILIILIVETFKDGFELKAQSPLELLYVGATIALIGVALYLTHSNSEKEEGPMAQNRN